VNRLGELKAPISPLIGVFQRRGGVPVVFVHAIDEDALGFYRRHGLEPSPTDPRHLMILIKDVAAALDSARQGQR
jgi:hypothetical protein